MDRRQVIATLAGSTIASGSGPAGNAASSQDWNNILAERLPLYGHRNWIVIADSAYPAQSRPGIETVVSNAEHFDVLKTALAAIAASRHVHAIVYQDQELKFVPERDAPGVDQCRRQLDSMLSGNNVSVLPHEEIIHKLDQTSQTFNVLIIKTTLTIPYTSVFLQLDCAYWPADAEKRLRAVMAGNAQTGKPRS